MNRELTLNLWKKTVSCHLPLNYVMSVQTLCDHKTIAIGLGVIASQSGIGVMIAQP